MRDLISMATDAARTDGLLQSQNQQVSVVLDCHPAPLCTQMVLWSKQRPWVGLLQHSYAPQSVAQTRLRFFNGAALLYMHDFISCMCVEAAASRSTGKALPHSVYVDIYVNVECDGRLQNHRFRATRSTVRNSQPFVSADGRALRQK